MYIVRQDGRHNVVYYETSIHLNLYTQHFLHKYFFQNKSYFGGHLGGHLEFLETLNDANLASFRIFDSNISSNRINNKNYILQCRV